MPIDIRKLAQRPNELEYYRTCLGLRVRKDETLKEQLLLLEQALQLFASCQDVWKDAAEQKSDTSNTLTPHERYPQLQSQLVEISSALPNVYRRIDAEITDHETLIVSPQNSNNTKSDVMFAIGGYEELGSHGIMYTDIGIALIDSMHRFVLQWWTKQPTFGHATSFRHWKLPATLNSKPSWQVILEENHHHKKYFDRQLPIVYLLQCGGDGPTAAVDDSWEESPTMDAGAKGNWYQRKSTTWQIVVLTGPSYEVDVQPLQQKPNSIPTKLVASIGSWTIRYWPILLIMINFSRRLGNTVTRANVCVFCTERSVMSRPLWKVCCNKDGQMSL